MRNRLIIEALGTFFLCLAMFAGSNIHALAALYGALLYLSAPVGIAHYNPAVSLACHLRGRIGFKGLLACVGVQLAAGLVAVVVAALLFGYDLERAEQVLQALDQPTYQGMWAMAVIELLGTFMLALIFLVVGTSRLTAGNGYFGMVLALAFLGLSIAPFDPSLNPVAALVLLLKGVPSALFEGLFGTKAFATEVVLIAQVAPRVAVDVAAQLSGAALAAGLFRVLFPDDR